MGFSLVLLCNSWLFVIDLDYGYRYLLEVYSKFSDIFRDLVALSFDVMVNILALEL